MDDMALHYLEGLNSVQRKSRCISAVLSVLHFAVKVGCVASGLQVMALVYVKVQCRWQVQMYLFFVCLNIYLI